MGSQLRPGDLFSRDHFQGACFIPQLRGKIREFLTAIDANAYDGIVHAAVRLKSQLRKDSAELPLAVYQIIGPLDARPESGGFFHGIADGNGGGAGQVHQVSGGALWAQEHA